MKTSTVLRVFWAAVGTVAIALANPGCSDSSTHNMADVPEAKKKGKFGTDEAQAHAAAVAGRSAKQPRSTAR